MISVSTIVIFFVGYFLFEIPSNLILAKVGARRWIARILLTWGIISALSAFVWDSTSFYGVRFLRGLAEAGYYPGIILFLTWWFPARYRARMIAQFMTAIPVAVVTGYGLVLFLPQIVKRFGLSNAQTGFVTALPYLFGIGALIAWGMYSDCTGQRSGLCATACLVSAAALISCLVLDNPVLMMIAIIIAQMAGAGIAPNFWALPTAMLTGSAAAGGIALINAVGNLGGLLGPYAMGAIQDATGSFPLGLMAIATGSIVSGVVMLALGHDRRLEQAPRLTQHA